MCIRDRIESRVKLQNFLSTYEDKIKLIFTDLNSNKKKISLIKSEKKPLCILIGPEGDFSESERLKILIIFIAILSQSVALADQPKKWQMGFQEPASQSMRDIVWFHDYMLVPIIVAISAFVLFLMLYAMVRFRASRNPNPSKRTHNVLVEVVWTLIPCLILIVMAVPSFKVLYSQDEIPKAEVTIKAIGYQWYWGYEYPDENIIFDSYMIEDEDLKEGQPRLLAVDNEVVVPVNKVVKVLITANDVLHAWALPAFGVKRDAMPGRVNETWFKAERTGTFYGQCSELCGIKHAFMPITVRVVSEEEYIEWLNEAKIKFAKEPIEDKNKLIASK